MKTHAPISQRLRRRARRGSIIIVVLVTMAFAALALTIFMDKASNDLLVEIRDSNATRMRLEAYSAMETTLAILEDYRATLGSLHSPAEGWGAPDLLQSWGYEPLNPEYTVEVSFEDESGKLSLPNTQATTYTTLFKYWGLDESTSDKLADALLGWMKPNYVPTAAGAPQVEDYDTGELPFIPPERTLRSFDELASINYVRDIFYDENGRPNDLWQRFVQTFSLYDFQSSNINAAPSDLLGAMGSLDPSLDKKLSDFLSGADNHASGQAPGYFASKAEVGAFLGAGTPAGSLGVNISALRVIITVRQGSASSYRLNVLLAMPGSGGAKIPVAWAEKKTAADSKSGNTSTGQNNKQGQQPNAAGNSGTSRTSNNANVTRQNGASSTAKPLNYPYSILEIRENDLVPPPPPVIANATEQ